MSGKCAGPTSTLSRRRFAAGRSVRPMSYCTNYRRLQTVKQRFDPGNLFRMNLDISPAVAPQLQAAL